MTETEIKSTIAALVARIAPEIDLTGIDPDEDLRRALDIDSFDFLKLLIGVHEKLGIEVPESDYGAVRSLNALVSYIATQSGGNSELNTG